MDDRKLLLSLFAIFLALTAVLSLFDVTPAIAGLSIAFGTDTGTKILGTVFFGSVLSVGPTSVAYGQVFTIGQVAVGVSAVGFLFFRELSDQRYGRTKEIFAKLRESWVPPSAIFLNVLCVSVAFKILGFS